MVKRKSDNGTQAVAVADGGPSVVKKQKQITSFLVQKDGSKADKQAPKKSLVQDDGTLLSLITCSGWKKELAAEFEKPYFKKIQQFLDDECKKKKEVFPPREEIFNALNLTPIDRIKAVIIGQDPYHDNDQAHGLCFSVRMGIKPPPSLKNIYKELATDITGFKAPTHGFLADWAGQGVLLLNATLTVEAHKANSHSKIGWQTFTDEVIKTVSKHCDGVVFLLWGGFAHKKEALIDQTKHAIVKTAHPSPLSATKFFNCKCFSQANGELKKFGKTPVDWSLR